MRITGGAFGGRLLRVPRSYAIRPTQDRVREALFSIIQCELADADFLDLFAGSGAVGIEALSRGARTATFVESNRRHATILQANLSSLNVSTSQRPNPSTLIVSDCYRWIAGYAGPGFTIGFADPPYALGESRGYASVLATLATRGVIRPGGLFIAEMTAVQHAEETPGWELLRDRTYGKTRLCIWRLQSPTGRVIQ